MKKIVLSLAGVMAAAAFAPEASALPVFARQTGMACSACHFNHFPLLNGFGRSFKASGFTLMGAQGKVEDEHLSIPDRVNMAVLTTAAYEKKSGNVNAAAAVPGVGNASWSLPSSGGELSLFLGGKITDNAGFLAELGMTGAAAATASAKLPMLFEVADGTRAGLVFDTNNGQGVAHSFEILNTGAVNTHRIVTRGHETVYSAAQYLGTNFATSGASVVAVNNDMGFINLTKYEAAGQALGKGASNLPLTYFRVAALFEAAGLDMGVGFQNWSGTTAGNQFGIAGAGACAAPATAAQIAAANLAGVAVAAPVAGCVAAGTYKAQVIDFQAQGELGGLSTGLYASYGTAPVGSMLGNGGNLAGGASVVGGAGVANAFKATSLNVGADIEVSHGMTAKVALRSAKSGVDGLADNAFQLAGAYQLAQNLELGLIYTGNSGAHWNAATAQGKTVTTLMLEALF